VKKGIKIVLGIVAVGAILVFLFLYSTGDTALNKERKIHVLFPNVEGLIEASPLLVNGFRVGEVKRIDPVKDTSGYKMLVTFVITSKTINIPKNSTARIVSSDLFNKGVELMLNDTNVLISDKLDTLEGFTEETFKDKINKELSPLKEKAARLSSSFDSIKVFFNEIKMANAEQNLKASFKRINKSITALKLSKGKMDSLTDPDKTAIKAIMQKVNSISANITNNQPLLNRMKANFNNIYDAETKARITQIMQDVGDAMAGAKDLVASMNSGKGTAGKAMNTKGIQDNLTKADNDLDVLLKEMIRNPDRFFKVSWIAPKKVPYKPTPPDTI
jgi:phospholipid/cholesterol/gamma-HCH transport system substrate-binding protein